MDIRKVSDTVSVGGQISPQDVADLANAGFKTIICNRPDGEEIGQPQEADIEAAAREAGLEFVSVPLANGGYDPALPIAFGEALSNHSAPAFAYCRSGMRSCLLWAVSENANGTPADQVMQAAANAGYDLRPMAGLFQR